MMSYNLTSPTTTKPSHRYMYTMIYVSYCVCADHYIPSLSKYDPSPQGHH